MVDDFLAILQVSCFVAMYFAQLLPCIGKVLVIEDDNFRVTVHYWKGTYYGK